MREIFFDESGFTGNALLDPDQPYFAIASSSIPDDEASRILRQAFPDFNGPEFKFQKIWSRQSNKKGLVKFCELIGQRKDDCFLWHVDKRFCVLTKMIDYLIEPIFHAAGRDFYKNAHAYHAANYVYTGLLLVGSSKLYDATVRAFYEFAIKPNYEALARLKHRLTLLRNSGPEETKFFFNMALTAVDHFNSFYDMETFKEPLEIYGTSMLTSVSHWCGIADQPIAIIHDQSNHFFRQKELWDAITSPDVPEQLHPVANGPSIQFPLPIASTAAVVSRAHKSIQLCDILAGITTKFVDPRAVENDKELFAAILETDFKYMPSNGIKGEFVTEMPEPALLDGPDPVDRMVDIVNAGRKKSR